MKWLYFSRGVTVYGRARQLKRLARRAEITKSKLSPPKYASLVDALNSIVELVDSKIKSAKGEIHFVFTDKERNLAAMALSEGDKLNLNRADNYVLKKLTSAETYNGIFSAMRGNAIPNIIDGLLNLIFAFVKS